MTGIGQSGIAWARQQYVAFPDEAQFVKNVLWIGVHVVARHSVTGSQVLDFRTFLNVDEARLSFVQMLGGPTVVVLEVRAEFVERVLILLLDVGKFLIPLLGRIARTAVPTTSRHTLKEVTKKCRAYIII
jgi:hypothetical protein